MKLAEARALKPGDVVTDARCGDCHVVGPGPLRAGGHALLLPPEKSIRKQGQPRRGGPACAGAGRASRGDKDAVDPLKECP